MKTHNAENERIKRQYFIYLKEAKRYSESSLDGAAIGTDRNPNPLQFYQYS